MAARSSSIPSDPIPGHGADERPIRLAVDTLGGDAEATILVRGALDAVARPLGAVGADSTRAVVLRFFGDARTIGPLLSETPHEVAHAPRCVQLGDPLRAALRGEIDSSMRSAIASLARGEVDAVVSSGSTGALVALSRHLLGMLPGVRRPAIMKALAAADGGRFQMLDLGANIGSDAAQLHQFALMGSTAAMCPDAADGAAPGEGLPRVGLLNIGSEFQKGPAAVRAAAHRLELDDRIRYAGYVEPHRLFDAATDVVVADGYVGNIALKAAEGAARMARYVLTRELAGAKAATALAKTMLRKRLRRATDAYNPQTYNGAMLLGLAGVVVKSHGGADRQGFRSAVRYAGDALATGLVDRIANGM